MHLDYITAEELRERIDPDRARELIELALLGDFRPEDDPTRQNVPIGEGHLLLMPSALDSFAGVKVASVAPGNPERGLPRIQATYILMDKETLAPRLILEGTALTALRTPATTAVACDRLAPSDASTLVVFGSGPQAVEHVVAMARVRELSDIRIVGRSRERLAACLQQLAERSISAGEGTADDVGRADIVVCATSAEEPLFDGSLVRGGAFVAAIGSHEPDRRELPGDLLGRALVVVEDVDTALRDAGDIVLAVREQSLDIGGVRTLREVVRGEVLRAEDRPNVFKGVGMSWQDLAVASGLVRRQSHG